MKSASKSGPPRPVNRMFVPQIKSYICVGCDKCVSACKHGVFSRGDQETVAAVSKGELCTGCSQCLRECITKAIQIVPAGATRRYGLR